MNKTWKDVEVAALHDPILQAAVTMHAHCGISREQALTWAVLAQGEIVDGLNRRLLGLLRNTPARDGLLR